MIGAAYLGLAGGAIAADPDGDGVTDSVDNCHTELNAGQADADGDGYGDRCDAGYNDDCVVDIADYDILVAAIGSVVGEDNFLAAEDHDGDGATAGSDIAFNQRLFGL